MFRLSSLLKFEDTLYADPLYYEAVSKAVGIYLQLHDRMVVASQSQQAPQITEYNVLIPPTELSQEANPDSVPNENGDSSKPEEESTKSKKALKKAKMAEIKAKAQAALDAKKGSSFFFEQGAVKSTHSRNANPAGFYRAFFSLI